MRPLPASAHIICKEERERAGGEREGGREGASERASEEREGEGGREGEMGEYYRVFRDDAGLGFGVCGLGFRRMLSSV